jgi:membrane-associated phospholipid phosphatase
MFSMRQWILRAAILLGAGVAGAASAATVVVDWNNSALAEIRAGRLGPPIVARALAISHTCMYDAWAAYDARAIGAVLGSSLRRPVSEHTDANKAKAVSFAAYRCLLNLFPAGAARLDLTMRGLGYDPTDLSADVSTPQGIGNVTASAVIDSRRDDGSNQYGDLAPGAYADYTGYAPRNLPLPFCTPQTVEPCPPNTTDPNHWQPLISDTGSTQTFIAPHWEQVKPFALTSASQFDNQPPPNYLQGPTNYAADVDDMLRYSAELDLTRKVAVEYWADGPASELPPGHWALFAQFVSQRDQHTIDKDVKMFFAMHNASFDAGIVAWHQKRRFDGVRPITAVRVLKQGTQVFAWGGPSRPSEVIAGEKWTPYNPGSNLTPSFPGYISGHSTFSSASAAVLRSFTGSDSFGFSTVIPPDFGRVEPGIPPVPTTVSYPSFSAATAEAGQSRLWGGIHFADDNTVGQTVGALIGAQAWSKAQFLFNGGLIVESSTNAVCNKSNSFSWPHTISNRTHRLLLVGVSYVKGKEPVSAVTYGGAALKRLGAQAASKDEAGVELWYTLAPAVGTAQIVVSLPTDVDVVGGAMSFTGVDQATPFGSLRSSYGDKTNLACVTLASATTELIANVLSAKGDARSVTVRPGQTTYWDTGTGTGKDDALGTGTTARGQSSSTVCQTLENDKPWAMIAVPLKPALVLDPAKR